MPAWRIELSQLIRLATPVALVQVGMMAMNVVDTMMMGRVSAAHMAAVQIGHAYSFTLVSFGMGCLIALDPVLSQAVGARDQAGLRRGIQRGMVLALIMSVPLGIAVWPADSALTWLRQKPELVPIATGYVRASIPGVLPFFLFVVWRHALQAQGITRPLVATIIAANLLNVGLNVLLIFPHEVHWGGVTYQFGGMGAIGSAWATTVSRWGQAAAILIAGWSVLGPQVRPFDPRSIAAAPLWRLFVLGVPIGLQFTLEIGAFNTVALLMGSIGEVEAAANAVAINLASLSFMIPLGVSMAVTVRVGQAIGRRDFPGMRRSAGTGLLLGAGVMLLSGLVFASVPEALARLYTDDVHVIALAAILLPIAACFQVFDGLQIVSSAILRGAGDTRWPALVHLVGFWGVGLGLGWWWGLHNGASNPTGIWWGLVAGLASVALVLMWRVGHRVNHPPERIDLDREPTRA